MSHRLSSHFSLFKQSTPRAFDFTPRYYDEEKERKAEIEAMIAAGRGNAEASIRKELLSKRIRHQWQRKHTGKAMNFRLIGILLVLMAVLYIFYKNYLPA